MSTINTHYKATEVASPAPSAAASTPATDPVTAQLLAEIEKALAEIEKWKTDNGEYFEALDAKTLENLGRIEMTLKAQAALLPTMGMSGGSGLPGEGASDWDPRDLKPEWNGVTPNPEDAYGQDVITADPDKYGEYGGTIKVPNNGRPTDPTQMGFQMTDDMTSVTVESHGRDLIFTVGYDKDGDGKEDAKKSYVIKDGSMQQGNFVITARGLTHGVTIDTSRAVRVDKGSATGKGFYIFGTDYDDTIKCGGGDDVAVGGFGADTIDGGLGSNTIFGDEGPGAGGANSYVSGNNFDQSSGGNDTIYAGAGTNVIYGQGGDDDTVYGAGKGDSVMECENEQKADGTTELPDPASGWFESPSGDWEMNEEDGMYVIENTSASGNAGDLSFDMSALPPGYNMAYAEMDSDMNLIITFVNNETGESFKVKVKDFFSGGFGDNSNPNTTIPHIDFYGSDENDIIDFSNIKLNEGNAGQSIAIYGGGGDDLIMGMQNMMVKDGVDVNDPLNGTVGNGTLNDYVNDGPFATNETGDGYNAEVKDGQVYITKDPNNKDGPADRLNIVAPDGYEMGYVTQDTEGNIYVVLVKKQESGKADTMVIKIDKSICASTGGKIGFEDISIKHRETADGGKVTWGEELPLTPFSLDDLAYTLDGGDGSDLYFVEEGSPVEDDGSDDVVEVQYDDPIEQQTPASTPTSTEDPKEDTKTETIDGDTNDDGVLSDSEYKTWAKKNNPDEIDGSDGSDKDGTISSDEWDAWVKDNPNPEK
ncbi:MAG: calcium-binding protein [bacterium]